MIAAAFDVGGMSIKRGLVDWTSSHTASIDQFDAVDIDATAAEVDLLDQFAGAFEPLLIRCHRVGVAFPGPMDYERGVPLLRGQRKFDSIHGVDLRAWATHTWPQLDLDIHFVNDAAAAAIGEHLAGASRGSARSLLVTLGTGFGAAALIDGRQADVVAGLEIPEMYRRPVADLGCADDVLSAVGLADLLGVRPGEVAAEAAAARRGDRAAADGFATFGARLGEFLGAMTAAMDLDVVVVGGGGAQTFDLFGPTAASELPVALRPALLGADAPLIGATAPDRSPRRNTHGTRDL